MSMRSFFGKLRRKILRIMLGRDLFTRLVKPDVNKKILNRLDTLLNESRQAKTLLMKPEANEKLLNRLDAVLNESHKIKTLLLLKEQSPELLREFAAGLCNDNDFIRSLAKTNVFKDLQQEFACNIALFLEKFICGAPNLGLSALYKNQISLAKNPLYRCQAFSNMLAIFMPQYENNEIARELEKMYDKSFFLIDRGAILRYMAWLLLRKEEEKAMNILFDYLRYNELASIGGFIPVADLAHRNGITNDAIAAASYLFQTIMKNVNNRILESYIDSFGKDVTIAIVGNGPHELGLGKGAEIDAHDIVIRFNKVNTDEKYVKDYGEKTNILFFTATGGPNPAAREEFFKILDRPIDLFVTHSLYQEGFGVDMIQKFKRNPFFNISTLEFSATKLEIQQKYNINWPTTGFRGIYYVKKILGKNIKKSDIYGFALNHGEVREGHYENTSYRVGGKMHDLFMEFEAMLDIFKE